MQDWVEKKHAESYDPTKPDKPFADGSNWMLTERWVVKQKGQTVSNETKMTEGMDKKADTMQSGLSLLPLGEGDGGKNKLKSSTDKHKQMMNKLVGGLNRLNRSIASCEAGLPSMKRKLDLPSFQKMKKGLVAIRDKKDDFWERVEEFKEVPDQEGLVENMVEEMSEMHKAIISDNQALAEAMAKSTSIVKNEEAKTETQKEEENGWDPSATGA